MPDITMCGSETCPLKTMCYRNPASGTRPSEYRQAWFLNIDKEGDDCKHYWPKEDQGPKSEHYHT
jgi:hypothetical protein